ncbi:MAG: restriction endonuclease [Marmoricola sp.]
MIDQDALGLSRVHVQAKRYAKDTAVSRPEIQGFIGAMAGAKPTKGVFITTGRGSLLVHATMPPLCRPAWC